MTDFLLFHRFDNPSFTLDSDGEATESNTQQRSAKVEIFSKPSSSASAITKIKSKAKTIDTDVTSS